MKELVMLRMNEGLYLSLLLFGMNQFLIYMLLMDLIMK